MLSLPELVRADFRKAGDSTLTFFEQLQLRLRNVCIMNVLATDT